LTTKTDSAIVAGNKEQMQRTEYGHWKEVQQRAVGWCETVYDSNDYPLRAVH